MSIASDIRIRKELGQGYEAPYRQMIEGLVWIYNVIRPDVMDTVRDVAKQAHDPAPQYWKTTLTLADYLNLTRRVGVRFFQKGKGRLQRMLT